MISKSRRSPPVVANLPPLRGSYLRAAGVRQSHDLVNSAAVDVVAITVKVPYHFELAADALNAGKAVYCEWPLGNGLEEAERLAALAEKKACLPWSGCKRGPRRPLRMFMI